MEAKKLGTAPDPAQQQRPALPPLRSKTEAAEAVKRFAHLTAELGVLVAALKQAQMALLEKYNPAIVAKGAAMQLEEERIRTWAESNREEFQGSTESRPTTLEFSHGFLKFRPGPRKIDFRYGWDEEKSLQKLLSFPVTSQWQEYIRRTPSIDRQEILKQTKPKGKLPEARLAEVGLKIVREESFNVEPKPEAVAGDCDLMP